MIADLDGPLDDFFDRTAQIRAVISVVDSSVREGNFLSPKGKEAATALGLSARSTIAANSMAWVFLASSFEEFYREMVAQSAVEIFSLFSNLPDSFRASARSSYWDVCLKKLRFSNKILAKGAPVKIDADSLGRARNVVDSASKLVMRNEADGVDEKIVAFHTNNFKPHIVEEIGRRIGLSNMIRACSDTRYVRSLFTGNLNEIESKLRAALNEFYDTRNEIVHSLSSVAGQGTSNVTTNIELFEAVALGIQSVLKRHLRSLAQKAA